MRVVFYALPFTALLAASAIFPQRFGAIRSFAPRFRLGQYGRFTLWSLAFVIVLGSACATTVARGGNDAYESFSKGELAAVNYVYKHVRFNDNVVFPAPYLPYNQADVGAINWYSYETFGATSVGQIKTGLLKLHPQFIILSQSQENWGEVVVGLPKGWEGRLFLAFVNSGFRVAASWPTATVLVPVKAR